MMKHRLILLGLMIVVTGVACTSESPEAGYLREASTLCDAHNPATWTDIDFDKLTAVEKANMLSQKIQAAIHSDKMMAIFQQLVKDPPEQAYANYARNVSKLIGKKYECLYIKDYLSAAFQ